MQSLGLWVGAICHDLDHRGYNNKFMLDVASPLAAVYSTSTMERHHFSVAVSLLQRSPNNILAGLSHAEYTAVLTHMKERKDKENLSC